MPRFGFVGDSPFSVVVFEFLIPLGYGAFMLTCEGFEATVFHEIGKVAQFIKIAFEAASALATVGSSLGITADLTSLGKIVIIMMMYIGRIGISTLLISILRHKSGNTASNKVSYPTGNIIVG